MSERTSRCCWVTGNAKYQAVVITGGVYTQALGHGEFVKGKAQRGDISLARIHNPKQNTNKTKTKNTWLKSVIFTFTHHHFPLVHSGTASAVNTE